MTPLARKLLKESIQHWFRLSNGAVEPIGRAYCPLCWEFNDVGINPALACVGCPVHAKTGAQYCRQTPYVKIEQSGSHPGQQKFIKLAQKELDFLQSLLPETQNTP